MVRIASTWTIFSVTMDEPMHISAGLESFTQRTSVYQPATPRLTRIVLAFAPWRGGMEFDPRRDTAQQLVRVFYSNGVYQRNLVLARAGNLFFFALASLATLLWTRREMGSAAGLIAALLFTMQPVVLGHAGLATADVAATAGVALSLLAFSRWLQTPSIGRASAFGAAYGFASLCKLSCVAFVPAAAMAMYVVRVLRDEQTRRAWRQLAPSFFAAAVAALLVVWAGDGFTFRYFLAGVRAQAAYRGGHLGFLLGAVSGTGWWSYFPVALALKTTLASLLLALSGLAARRGVIGEALAAATAILAVAMTSPMNVGVRHILPIYAPLAVAAAGSALVMVQSGRRALQVAAALLLLWHAGASILAHPDGLPYFNELAGREPGRYLLDSNIDWGQDVLRLRRVIREKNIDHIGLAVFGWHDYAALGFPPHYQVQRHVPSQGWVAVSEHLYGLNTVPWVRGRDYERVGRSIRLYYIP